MNAYKKMMQLSERKPRATALVIALLFIILITAITIYYNIRMREIDKHIEQIRRQASNLTTFKCSKLI